MKMLLLALLACGKDTPVDSEPAPEDSVPVERYGPDNRWYHAPVSEVPEAPEDARYRVGQPLPELLMTDQFGDEVSLYQFAGRLVVMDIAGAWCAPCHQFAPFIEDFHQRQGEDGAIVITVLLSDVEFEPADADDLAAWVAEHQPTGPAVIVSSPEQRLQLEEFVGAYPSLMVVDPRMRLVTPNANDLDSGWWQEILDWVQMGVGGNLDHEEVCGDGIDNDLDFAADCMLASCHGDASCAQGEVRGELQPCATIENGGVGDTWRVEVRGAVAEIVVDTVSADTVFEPLLYARRPDQAWSEAWTIGDDEMDCTFPAATFGCAVGSLLPGTHDIAVLTGFGDEGDGDCVDPARGGYVIRTRGDVTLTLLEAGVTDLP